MLDTGGSEDYNRRRKEQTACPTGAATTKEISCSRHVRSLTGADLP